MTNEINKERELFNDAVMEHLGPTSLIGGSMSVLDAFELGWQARASVKLAIPTGWQPIETAPKDQTPIDIWANGRRMPNMSRFGVDNKDVYFDATTSECVFIVVVTHWMPLPTPPQGEPL